MMRKKALRWTGNVYETVSSIEQYSYIACNIFSINEECMQKNRHILQII